MVLMMSSSPQELSESSTALSLLQTPADNNKNNSDSDNEMSILEHDKVQLLLPKKKSIESQQDQRRRQMMLGTIHESSLLEFEKRNSETETENEQQQELRYLRDQPQEEDVGAKVASATQNAETWKENVHDRITLLCEIVGGTQIAINRDDIYDLMKDASTTTTNSNTNDNEIQPYCIVKYKNQVVHETKRAKQGGGSNPIWTLSTSSIFTVDVTPHDLVYSDDSLHISIWYKVKDPLNLTTLQTICLGHGRIHFVNTILKNLQEQRIDIKLTASASGVGALLPDDDDDDGSDLRSNNCRGTITCRFRIATESDQAFLGLLHKQPELLKQNSIVNLNSIGNWDNTKSTKIATGSSRYLLLNNSTSRKGKKKKSPSVAMAAAIKAARKDVNLLVTEANEAQEVGKSFFNALTSAFTSKTKRSAEGHTKILVKPGPDPKNVTATTYLSKHELYTKQYEPSHSWIEAGSGKLGRLYLEILNCTDLPNVDVGEAVGNLTDCFITAVFEDAVVQTAVIDDELNPIWMPWTQRAFVMGILHPASHLYLGAFDYDLGPSGHEAIGRVAINLHHFQPNTDYTLKYNLYPSSNLTDRISTGTITIRLRIEYNNEKEALLTVVRDPIPKFHVNVQKEKSLSVVRYTCFGIHGADDLEQPFDMTVTRSYINELFEYKAAASYAIHDAFVSLLLWRGQVQLWNTTTKIPFHSFVFFSCMTIVIERPWLLPSFLCIAIGYIMVACQTVRRQHPSPWSRCHSIWYYLEVLRYGKSSCSYRTIKSKENYQQAIRYEQQIAERLQRDEKTAETQAALQQKLLDMGDENIHTKLPIGISFDLYVRLTRYQSIIGRYCSKLRYIKLLVTWEDSITSFWITAFFLGGGIVSLLLPWKFLLTWLCRIVVWGLFGPQMKLVDWLIFSKGGSSGSEGSDADDEVVKKMMERFQSESQVARMKRQDAIKLQDMKNITFGKYSTRVPLGNICRHYDRPLPESFAKYTPGTKATSIKIAEHCIPGQNYYGSVVLPRTEQEACILQQEMEDLQSYQETFQRTAKSLYDDEQSKLINRLKSQSSINDPPIPSEGMELIHYETKPNNNNTNDTTDSSAVNDDSNETQLVLGGNSTLSLNLKSPSTTVAILHNEKNEGSCRRRSSTFRGGYEMLHVVRDGDDDSQSARNNLRSSTKVYSLQLGAAGSVVIDSVQHLAIVDTKAKDTVTAIQTTTTTTTQTTTTTTTATTAVSVQTPFQKKTYQTPDPFQNLTRRSVSSFITQLDDEEREALSSSYENVEIVLRPPKREENTSDDEFYYDAAIDATDNEEEDADDADETYTNEVEQGSNDNNAGSIVPFTPSSPTTKTTLFNEEQSPSSCVLYFQPSA